MEPSAAENVLLLCRSRDAAEVGLERVFVPAQVAHAYLHAESTPAGRLDDGSIVAQVATDLLPVPTTHYAMPFTEWRCILT